MRPLIGVEIWQHSPSAASNVVIAEGFGGLPWLCVPLSVK